MTLLISFHWDEGEGMSYDTLMEHLMHLGAYDIEEQEAELSPAKHVGGGSKKPKEERNG